MNVAEQISSLAAFSNKGDWIVLIRRLQYLFVSKAWSVRSSHCHAGWCLVFEGHHVLGAS